MSPVPIVDFAPRCRALISLRKTVVEEGPHMGTGKELKLHFEPIGARLGPHQEIEFSENPFLYHVIPWWSEEEEKQEFTQLLGRVQGWLFNDISTSYVPSDDTDLLVFEAKTLFESSFQRGESTRSAHLEFRCPDPVGGGSHAIWKKVTLESRFGETSPEEAYRSLMGQLADMVYQFNPEFHGVLKSNLNFNK